MELLLLRNRAYKTHTIGQLYIDQTYFCFVLEDVIRAVKIQNETAIPQGRYKVTLELSRRFGPDTLTVNRVPGYEGIRIHSGNTDTDTDGCLIVGYKLDANYCVAYGTTKPALLDLKGKVKQALMDNKEVWLTIKNVF